ncbi:hypothetical protein ACP70R_044561 [Stipagrostis hirtigluma subsp. patula]
MVQDWTTCPLLDPRVQAAPMTGPGQNRITMPSAAGALPIGEVRSKTGVPRVLLWLVARIGMPSAAASMKMTIGEVASKAGTPRALLWAMAVYLPSLYIAGALFMADGLYKYPDLSIDP